MPNPFTMICPPEKWPSVIGKSIDGQFLIRAGRYDRDSENIRERIGYVEIQHVGPLSPALYEPYTEEIVWPDAS